MSDPIPDRLLRRPEVLARTGLSKTSVYSFVASGTFPAPVVIGPRSVAWKESDLNAWIASRVSARAPIPGKATRAAAK